MIIVDEIYLLGNDYSHMRESEKAATPTAAAANQMGSSVSFSVAPRSRLKKPPGIRPAAENFS